MRFSPAIFILTLISLCVSSVHAEIYTCKDAKGNTVYTDSPSACANAEEVEVDALPTLIPTKPLAAPSSNSRSKKEEEKNLYTELVITSPSNDSTIRDNQGNLTINFRVTPALQARNGHKYVVTVDGTEVYSGTSTITALKNVDRGTHTIGVKVVATDGSIKIAATPVQVTLQRFSALQNQENRFNDGDPDADNDSSNNDSSDDDNQDLNNNTFSFPTNTKLPTRPPPPPPPSPSKAN